MKLTYNTTVIKQCTKERKKIRLIIKNDKRKQRKFTVIFLTATVRYAKLVVKPR